jgi:hypothetical protein
MTAASRAATIRSRLPNPWRAALHGLLLRGLRAPRLPHAPGWKEGSSGGQGLIAFQVRGGRGQTLTAWLALPRAADAEQPVPVVVGVHGWGANGSTLAPIVEPLVRAGIAVALFDAAGHVDSSAQTALDRAIGSAHWLATAKRHFKMPIRLASFEDFERRMMRPTFADHGIDNVMVDRVR